MIEIELSNESIYDQPGLKADFANAYIGGGSLQWGRLQEEILFAIHPEMLVSMMFTEVMQDNEAICIVGAQKFALHSGYADSFNYKGIYEDKSKVDLENRLDNHHVAFDALIYKKQDKQYDINCILREINKATIAFQGDKYEQQQLKRREIQSLRPVVTGNWGCGAFGGDPNLKFLIQWIAATLNRRKMIYCPFQDQELITFVNLFIKDYQNRTIGEITSFLLNFK